LPNVDETKTILALKGRNIKVILWIESQVAKAACLSSSKTSEIASKMEISAKAEKGSFKI